MLCLLTLICAFSFSVAPSSEPPLPNVDDPVDYIQWINKHYTEGLDHNAADIYLKAFEEIVIDKDLLELALRNPAEWSDDERTSVQTYLDRNKKALSLFAQAADIRECYFKTQPSASGAVAEAPSASYFLNPMRNLVKLMKARAKP